MKIKQILDQHRRDFKAIMACEFCGHEEMNTSGYDDRYYHDHVIPEMKCEKCKKSTISEDFKNGQESAFPLDQNVSIGLTKREYFAAMAMQVILANRELQIALYKDIPLYTKEKEVVNHENCIAFHSVKHADLLLKQLGE